MKLPPAPCANPGVARLQCPPPRIVPRAEEEAGPRAAPLPIPAGVQEMIALRLSRLSPACVDLLTVAAVIGQEFDGELLQAAASLPAATSTRTRRRSAASSATKTGGSHRYETAPKP